MQCLYNVEYQCSNGIEAGLGMGPYILYSEIEMGSLSSTPRFELGLTLFVVYNYSIGNGFYIAPELRFQISLSGNIFSHATSITFRSDIGSY